jgi:hypothetical protein
MFLMNLKTLRSWLMMHEFEMLINLIGIFIFTILLCIKYDLDLVLNSQFRWIYVFTPLFFIDALQAYFNFIVFIRLYKEYELKTAIIRFIFTMFILLLKFLFKILVYFTIMGEITPKFAYINLPIFLLFSILMCKSCTLKNFDIIE